MPPRYAYWTILIDDQPTAFRATKQEELQPTLVQLRRTNTNVVLKWFARGRLWESPEQAQWASRNLERPTESRGAEWRPGGKHEDPRARFDRKKRNKRDHPSSTPRGQHTAPRDETRHTAAPKPDGDGPRPDSRRDRPVKPGGFRPPFGKPGGDRPPRPRHDSGQRFDARPSDRPHSPPGGQRHDRKPFAPRPEGKPFAGSASSDRPRDDARTEGRPGYRPHNKPFNRRPATSSFRERPEGDVGAGKRPWDRQARPPRSGDRPWNPRPGAPNAAGPQNERPRGKDDRRPWSDRSDATRTAKPWGQKPGGKAGGKAGGRPWSGKPRGPHSGQPHPRSAQAPVAGKRASGEAENGGKKRDRSDDES